MTPEDEFQVRPGRIRSGGARKSFVGQVLGAVQKAGGRGGPGGRPRASVFGQGRAASLNALRRIGGRSRQMVIKARVVRQLAGGAPLGVHIKYLERDDVSREGAVGRLFGAAAQDVDGDAFAERCAPDRHHFRFIVSPQDAAELADLQDFTRDLMAQARDDLGTELDWVAVDHWNTAHPHVHILVRGVDQAGQDLVISRDYIAEGLRARASHLVTLELGPRTDQEIRRGLTAEIEAERWTRLDQALTRDAAQAGGIVDLRRPSVDPGAELRRMKLARLAKLQRLGLAETAGKGRWRLSSRARPTLDALARRGDVIARMHRAITDSGIERGAESLQPETVAGEPLVVGRLLSRGLEDELKGSGWAVIDGVDGRVHHASLPTLEAAIDAPVGSVVEVRWLEGRPGRPPAPVLSVRSDLPLAEQVGVVGATWLDHQLVSPGRVGLTEVGFGAEVQDALALRARHLIAEGLATVGSGRIHFQPGLIEILRRRDLAAAAARIAGKMGLVHRTVEAGERVEGVVRRRLTLASGRFALVDDGLGFSLVPWTADLQRRLGQSIAGVGLPGGRVDWGLGRQRGPQR